MTLDPDSRPRPRLLIDRHAIVDNWRLLKRRAAPADVAAVVKADAYGLGAAQVAPALRAAGCHEFFVALLEEGIALRRVLPDARIYILDGLGLGMPGDLAAANLVPVLNRPDEIALCASHARARRAPLAVALHVDTGMTRLGLSARQVADLDSGELAGLDVVLVMSHLACPELPEHPLNAEQRARFAATLRRLPRTRASLAASSGIFLGNDFHFSLCRAGMALYGANPTPSRRNPMAPVVTLVAPVLQVHEIDDFGSVGYGATYAVRPGMRIATLPLGYADGIPRAAGGRATVRIAGVEAPIVGRISMDLVTIDVSHLPNGAVEPGTEVEVIGSAHSVDDMAAAADTIAYEILTRLGRRFERVWQGSGA